MLVVFSHSSPAATLLVLGDSLSAGYGLAPKQGWVDLLGQRLAQEYPHIKVVNASISGETTQGGLTRLTPLLAKYQPRWVILELAANDGLRGTPIALIERQLSRLIETSQQAGAKVLLVGIHLPPNYGPVYTTAFFQIFETLADRHQITRVPFLLEQVALNRELMQADGLHPNAAAQPHLLENVWPYLQPLLETADD